MRIKATVTIEYDVDLGYHQYYFERFAIEKGASLAAWILERENSVIRDSLHELRDITFDPEIITIVEEIK